MAVLSAVFCRCCFALCVFSIDNICGAGSSLSVLRKHGSAKKTALTWSTRARPRPFFFFCARMYEYGHLCDACMSFWASCTAWKRTSACSLALESWLLKLSHWGVRFEPACLSHRARVSNPLIYIFFYTVSLPEASAPASSEAGFSHPPYPSEHTETTKMQLFYLWIIASKVPHCTALPSHSAPPDLTPCILGLTGMISYQKYRISHYVICKLVILSWIWGYVSHSTASKQIHMSTFFVYLHFSLTKDPQFVINRKPKGKKYSQRASLGQ